MTALDTRLAEMQATADKATDGPWRGNEDNGHIFLQCEGFQVPVAQVFDNPDSGMDAMGDEESDHNRRFIAASRTTVSALIKALKLARAQRDALLPLGPRGKLKRSAADAAILAVLNAKGEA